MKSKKDLKQAYKEREKQAGVFQVKNTVNGKILLGSSLNLDGPSNRHKFLLTIGGHPNQVLQQEWNEYGPDKFIFEILEVVQVKDEPNFKLDEELSLLEEIWIEELQPFGERGYNTDVNIRQV
ncbi:MAG: GIY-YIG nuclease family protein [Anaerolineales bacterium]|nr:GIY-YIG nuclease family protein [Anaerolineales bacterium]